MSSRSFKPSPVLTDSALSTAAPLALGLRALQATNCTEYLPSQQQETCVTKLLRPTMSAEATKRVLRRRAVEKPSVPVATTEAKFEALARFPLAFNPSPQAIAFTQKVVATVRESALLRDPAQPAYEKFINQQAAMMHGGPAHSMPTLLQSQQGYGFVLASPTGVGRSAYLQRLHVYLGTNSQFVHPHGDASTQLIFVPMLLVMWPTCGTMRGFLLAMRDALSVAIGSSVGSQILKNFTGKNGPQVAISVCIFFNVGLLTIDGACMASLRGEYPQILEFVSRFQRQTGIPTLISCTYPMAQIISRGGGNGQNLSNVAAEYWDLLPMGKQWASYCEFFWNIGMVGADVKMPSYLPEMLWKASQGSMRICSQAFLALHHAMTDMDIHPLKCTENLCSQVIERRLRFFSEPLKVMALYQSEGVVPMEDLCKFGDYLPYSAFQNTPSGTFENQNRYRNRVRKNSLLIGGNAPKSEPQRPTITSASESSFPVSNDNL